VVRDRGQRLILAVDELEKTIEAPLHPLDPFWKKVSGVVGAVMMPDGAPIFLIDPFRVKINQPLSPGQVSVDHDRRPKILVVDDSLTQRKMLARFLEKYGAVVAQAKDGKDALDWLALDSADLVILDIEMPRMDGFECAKNIRSHPKHQNMPIIMVTSRTAEKHRKIADAIGVQGFLGKPFPEEELSRLLTQILPDQK
jgi:chemosensory pili system protein ChpA (sensor histidine kinase/response regulator)